MDHQNGANFNDLMFGLYNDRPRPQQEVLESVSSDSGGATSVTFTRTDFSPKIMEYGRDFEFTCSEIEKMESIFDECENVQESLKNIDSSTFDLALDNGYNDQAKISYDDALFKGEKLKTKHVLPSDVLHAGRKELHEIDISKIGDEYWSKEFVFQRTFMLRKDFQEYLEKIEKNDFRTVMRRLKNKRLLNKQEMQIKDNISTKAKRNNLKIKEDTMKLIKDFIKYMDDMELALIKFCSELGESSKNIEKK